MTILRIPEDSPEWHAIRLRHIGGSEIAALFGLQEDFAQSAFTLHMVKSGRIPAPPVDDAPGTRIWYGKRKEATIAALAAELFGWDIEKGWYHSDDVTPGMGCSLDYVIKEPGREETRLGFHGPGVLQIKNVDWLEHKRKWTGGGPPFSIMLQVQQEMACSGMSWGVVACEIGGNDIRPYRFPASDKITGSIREKIAGFWQGVEDEQVPQIDGTDSTAAALYALYPSTPTPVPLDMRGNPRFAEVALELLVERAAVKAAAEREQAAKNELESLLQGATLAETDGVRVSVTVVAEQPARKGSRRIRVSEIITQ